MLLGDGHAENPENIPLLEFFQAKRVEQGVAGFPRAAQVSVKSEGLDLVVVLDGPGLLGPRGGKSLGSTSGSSNDKPVEPCLKVRDSAVTSSMNVLGQVSACPPGARTNWLLVKEC